MIVYAVGGAVAWFLGGDLIEGITGGPLVGPLGAVAGGLAGCTAGAAGGAFIGLTFATIGSPFLALRHSCLAISSRIETELGF